jgi:hypothetical protein
MMIVESVPQVIPPSADVSRRTFEYVGALVESSHAAYSRPPGPTCSAQ